MKKLPGISLILTSGWIGFEIVRYLSDNKLYLNEIIALSYPVGIAIVSVLTLGLNSVLEVSYLSCIVQCVILLVFSILFSVINNFSKKRWIGAKFSVSQIFLVIYIIFSFFMIKSVVFQNSRKIANHLNSKMYSTISMISSLSYGINRNSSLFDEFYDPITRNSTNARMFLPYYMPALLKSSTFTYKASYIVPVFLLIASSIALSWAYIHRVTNDYYSAVVGVPIIFLVGGLGFMEYYNPVLVNDPEHDFSSSFCGFNMPNTHFLVDFLISDPQKLYFFVLNIGCLFLFVLECKPLSYLLYSLCLVFAEDMIIPFSISCLVFRVIVPFVSISLIFSIKLTFPQLFSTITNTRLLLIRFISIRFGIFPFLVILFYNKKYKTQNIQSIITLVCSIFIRNNYSVQMFLVLSLVIPPLVIPVSVGIVGLFKDTENGLKKGVKSFLGLLFLLSVVLSSILSLIVFQKQQSNVWGYEDKKLSWWIINQTSQYSIFAYNGNKWCPATSRGGRKSIIIDFNNITESFDYFLIRKNSKEESVLQSRINTDLKIEYESHSVMLLSPMK